MAPVKVSLYVTEFYGMVSYLSDIQPLRSRPLAHHSVISLVLVEYIDYWRQDRVISWLDKSKKRRHNLSMPVSVATALYQVMRKSLDQLTDPQLMFYTQLKLATTNYQNQVESSYNIEAETVTGKIADISNQLHR